MGCGQSFPKSPCDSIKRGPNFGTTLETHVVSKSFLFCMVQHAAEWPDYYCILDMRGRANYNKSHVVGAQCYEDIAECLSDYTHEYIVIVYGAPLESGVLKNFLQKLSSEAIEPAALYILEESLRSFKKSYKFAMHDFEATIGQFPGPVEYLPATKEAPGVYCISRNNFAGCKHLVSFLKCCVVLNLSARRLFVKTPGIVLKNVAFEEDEEPPYDEAISTFDDYIVQARNRKGNVLIIDEPGCNYGAMLCGWYLVKQKGFELETVCEHITNKSAELDAWYTDTLREWAVSRR